MIRWKIRPHPDISLSSEVIRYLSDHVGIWTRRFDSLIIQKLREPALLRVIILKFSCAGKALGGTRDKEERREEGEWETIR